MAHLDEIERISEELETMLNRKVTFRETPDNWEILKKKETSENRTMQENWEMPDNQEASENREILKERTMRESRKTSDNPNRQEPKRSEEEPANGEDSAEEDLPWSEPVRARKDLPLFKPSDGLIAAFFVPVILMLIIFAQRGIFPFGEESFLRTDLYHRWFTQNPFQDQV